MGDIVVDTQEEQDEGLEIDAGAEAPAVDGADASDDEEELGTVVLEGEEETPEEESPPPQRKNPRLVRDLRRTIKERNRTIKAGNRERETLAEENARLKAQLEQQASGHVDGPASVPSGAAATKPTLAECGYNTERYEAAMDNWVAAQMDTRIETHLSQRENSQRQAESMAKANAQIDAHYERATALKVPDYSDMEEIVAKELGVELVQSIQSTIPNSEQVLYYLAKNPAKLEQVKTDFATSPGKGTVELGILSAKVSFKPNGKRPPDPDLGVPGGGGASSPQAQKLMRKLTAVTNAGGPDVIAKRREIFKEAESMGIELPRA